MVRGTSPPLKWRRFRRIASECGRFAWQRPPLEQRPSRIGTGCGRAEARPYHKMSTSEGDQSTGDHILTATRHRQTGPTFPICHCTVNAHRLVTYADNPPSDPAVCAQSGIKRHTVRPGPGDILIHCDQRVAAFPGGTYGNNQDIYVVACSDIAYLVNQQASEALAGVCRSNSDTKRCHRIPCMPGIKILHFFRHHPIPTFIRQCIGGTIPSKEQTVTDGCQPPIRVVHSEPVSGKSL